MGSAYEVVAGAALWVQQKFNRMRKKFGYYFTSSAITDGQVSGMVGALPVKAISSGDPDPRIKPAQFSLDQRK
jgi:hypothetical protein